MTLIETLFALILFAMTGGAVADMWYQTAHAVAETRVLSELDDVADAYAEQVLSAVLSDPASYTANTTSTWISSDGQTFERSLLTEPNGGREVVVRHEQQTQTLYVTVPR